MNPAWFPIADLSPEGLEAVRKAVEEAFVKQGQGAVPYSWVALVVTPLAGVVVTLFWLLMSEKGGRLKDAQEHATDMKAVAVTLDRATEALRRDKP